MRVPPSLAILCATRGEICVWPFLAQMVALAARCKGTCTFVADGDAAQQRLLDGHFAVDTIVARPPDGVHRTMQRVVAAQASEYVFFLDDDEQCAAALCDWLVAEAYRTSDLWMFPRAWLWPTSDSYIVGETHWPDFQVRLGRRARVHVPTIVHGGWIPRFQPPTTAPCTIVHHKLVLRSRAERIATVAHYERLQAGAGFSTQYLPDERRLPLAAWNG